MGVLFQFLDFSIHLTFFYLFRTDVSVPWYVISEFIYCLLKVITALRPTLNTGPLRPLHPHEHDMESVEWLNEVIRRLWTPINRYLQHIFRVEITALLNEELQRAIKVSFAFVKLDLGTMPFQVEGVRSYPEDPTEEVCVDLDVLYRGNAEFVVRVGYVQAGIKNIQLRGTLRLILKPLLPELPVIGGTQLYFLEPPQLHYEFTNFLNFLNFEAVAGVLDKTIHGILRHTMVTPHALQIYIAQNYASHDLEIDLPLGIVRIHLIDAFQLEAADLHGVSNPYVEFTYGNEVFVSPVVEDSLSPTWNHFYQIVFHRRSERIPLTFTVFDQDPITRLPLGEGRLDLLRVQINGVIEEFYALENVGSGILHLRYEWRSLSDRFDDFTMQMLICQRIREKTNCILPVALCYVVAASKAHLDPFHLPRSFPVKVTARLGDQQRTSNRHDYAKVPAWKEVLAFPIYDLLHDEIQVEVVDGVKDVRLGQGFVRLASVLKSKGLTVSTSFEVNDGFVTLSVVSLRVVVRTFRAEGDAPLFEPDISVRSVAAAR
ncbi:extended synaptotagmin-2-like [Paramacrobiotus metropolitanus]|uniref:extended synaptotagmin-2-like n=1 Tax=Paramacrobiotus metropolitanus TaxID=2943436 RepID=UPI002445C9BA|nr:extended synaptotagmin-2-like [Paramacrobiotus metropolitanus]